MKLKIITGLLSLFVLGLSSCNNQLDELENLECISRSSMRFENGECVIAAVYYSAHFVGQHIPVEEIYKYFEDAGAVDSDGHILGISLNTQEWYNVFIYFLGGRPAVTERYLLEELGKGHIACCRTYDRSHAFILVSYDGTTDRFKYYDPILNNYSTVDATHICDPIVIRNRMSN
ncbi:MAG: hypothetical protein K2J42_00210 [Muribaculaceae bacterium]|nr:hypothetical protein [Muribaculaceae bacterium]